MRETPEPIIKQAHQLLTKSKLLRTTMTWQQDACHSRYISTQFAVIYDQQTLQTIKRATFQATYHHKKSPNDCKYAFSLFLSQGKVNYPVLQLEVYGKNRISHQDRNKNERFYGPHLHFSGEQIELSKLYPFNCQDFNEWFRAFCYISKTEFKTPLRHPHDKPEGGLL